MSVKENPDTVRKLLESDPANLSIADRYWRALEHVNGDVRTGRHAMETYRAAALDSSRGVSAMAKAYKELFEESGELPNREYFDEVLLQAIAGCEQAGVQDANINWMLKKLQPKT